MRATPWTSEEIAAKLATSDVFVERAVVAMLERQTADEKVARTTKHSNGIGFNGPDAAFLTWAANWVMGGKEKNIPEGKRLMCRAAEGKAADRNLVKVRTKLAKYSRQLAEIANEKLAVS